MPRLRSRVRDSFPAPTSKKEAFASFFHCCSRILHMGQPAPAQHPSNEAAAVPQGLALSVQSNHKRLAPTVSASLADMAGLKHVDKQLGKRQGPVLNVNADVPGEAPATGALGHRTLAVQQHGGIRRQRRPDGHGLRPGTQPQKCRPPEDQQPFGKSPQSESVAAVVHGTFSCGSTLTEMLESWPRRLL